MSNITISKRVLRSRITLIAFFCIFPLDAVFYAFRAVYGLSLPPIGLPAALAVLVFLPSGIRLIKGKTYTPILLFATFLFSGAFSALFSPLLDYELLSVYFWYVVSLILGYHFSDVISREDRLIQTVIITLSLVSSAVLIIILKDGWGNSVENFNYLRTASGLFYLSLLGLVITKNRAVIFAIYAITALALFYINSRNSFYLWLSLPLLYLIVSFRFSVRSLFYWLMLFVAVFLIWKNIDYLDLDHNIRVFRLILNPENDTSLNGRLWLNSQGWEQIIENPILGYYNGFMQYGNSGSYIHNILSYWHQFGLFAFVFLLAMIVFAARKAFDARNDVIGLYLKLSLVTSVLGLILAKSFVAYDIFFVIGLSVGISSLPNLKSGKKSRFVFQESVSIYLLLLLLTPHFQVNFLTY